MAEFTPHEAPAHEALSLPVMPLPKLIGRDTTMGQVFGQIRSKSSVLIYGVGGIGKTAMAAKLAGAYTESPGGVLWLRLNGDSLAQIVARVGRAYRSSDITSSENPALRTGVAASLLAENQPLVVLDGRLDPEAVAAFQAECASEVPLLILSEEELQGDWAVRRLGKLEPDNAAAMFRYYAGVGEDDAAVNGLMAALNYVPFAIVVAAGAVREDKKSVADFASGIPQAGAASVNAQLLALTAAFRPLPSALQGLILLMGASFTGGASAELLALASNATAETINKAMEQLLARHLIERTYRYGEPYYYLHAITQTFAQTWLRGSGKLDAFQQKMRDTLLAYVRKYSRTVAIAHDRLATEMDNLLAAAVWASSHGDREFAESAAIALAQAGDFVNARGYRYELVELRRLTASSTSAFPAHVSTTLPPAAPPAPTASTDAADDDELDQDELDADDGLDDDLDAAPGARAVSSTLQAFADDDLDELDTLDDGGDDFEDDAPDILPASGIGATLQAFADDDLDDDDLADDDLDDEADAAPSALPVRGVLPFEDEPDDADLDDDDLDDDDLDDSGLMPNALIELDADEDEEQDTGEIIARTDDEDDEDSVPVAAASSGIPPVAQIDPNDIARLRAALIQARTMADRRRQAELQLAIGSYQEKYEQDSAFTEAISAYSDALAQYEALNDPAGMLSSLEALARLTRDTDNSQAAVLHASRGAAMAEQLKNAPAQIRMLSTLGDARQQLGETENAISAYERALALAREQNDPRSIALVLFMLGYAYLDDGNAQRAIDRWEEALTLFRAQGQRDYEGRVLGGLGTAHGELGRWGEAISFHTSALYIAREVKDKLEEGLQLSNLGYAYVQSYEAGSTTVGGQNALGQAVLRYRQALHLAYESGSKDNIVSTTVDLVRLLLQSKRHLAIVGLLLDSAIAADGVDRDLKRLKERVDAERASLTPDVSLIPATGTAREYAANAYAQLED